MGTSARNRLRDRRAAKRRQARTRLIIGISIAGVALVAAIILISGASGPDTSISDEALTRYNGLAQRLDEQSAPGFVLGEDDAEVTVVEYSDFSCPHCADLSEIMHQIVDDYVRSDVVRIVYKTVASVNRQYSEPAAQAAICAGRQGKFWEMHDLLWRTHRSNSPAAYVPRILNPLAQALDLNMPQYSACLSSLETEGIINAVEAELQQVATQVGLPSVGTPMVVVNGEYVTYTGADDFYGRLASVIERMKGN